MPSAGGLPHDVQTLVEALVDSAEVGSAAFGTAQRHGQPWRWPGRLLRASSQPQQQGSAKVRRRVSAEAAAAAPSLLQTADAAQALCQIDAATRAVHPDARTRVATELVFP